MSVQDLKSEEAIQPAAPRYPQLAERARILVKFPTRSRPERFLAALERYRTLLSGRHDVMFAVIADADDPTMDSPFMRSTLNAMENVLFQVEQHRTKVEACNAPVAGHLFDILVLASDDMIPQTAGYDAVIAREMRERFPELDGSVHYYDGYCQSRELITWPVMGRRLIERLGFIYHPEYQSLWCNNELTDVLRGWGKYSASFEKIIWHDHSGKRPDALYHRNDTFRLDKQVYMGRRAAGFPLRHDKDAAIELPAAMTPTLSILIPSLQSRRALLEKLLAALESQIGQLPDRGRVEILTHVDNRQKPVGTKRNELLDRARGAYCVFVDDDDLVAPTYIADVLDCIHRQAGVDCVAIQGIMTTDGNSPRKFIFGTEFGQDHEKEGVYYRLPNHLCPVRRELASRTRFLPVNRGEDSDYARRLRPLIKTQARISTPLYYYLFSTTGTEAQRTTGAAPSQTPLVSCVMPTANRRHFMSRSIGCFLSQTYENKELLILDDESDSVSDLVPDHPAVRYVRLQQRLTLGDKRNHANRMAGGNLIMHWDDDDWFAPHRIAYQVENLQRAGAEVCGLQRMLFHDPAVDQTWLYSFPSGKTPWLAGGSLLYTRQAWQRRPFANIPVGEDTQFMLGQKNARIVALDDYQFYVATIHDGNTSRKCTTGACWSRWPGDIRTIMLECRSDDSNKSGIGGASPHAGEMIPTRPVKGAPYKIVILSAKAANLIACVESIFQQQPDFPRDHIVVVDDGARGEAEDCLRGVTWVQGEKPFVYARNANIGLRAAGADSVILNDDARLVSAQGFDLLSEQVQSNKALGLCSAAIRGIVGNRQQMPETGHGLRFEARTLAFVAVYLPRWVYERVGSLDERFTGYGFEDNDYSTRVRAAGLQLAIFDGCIVDHSGEIPSTFRTRPDYGRLFQKNRRLFSEKWKSGGANAPVKPAAAASSGRVDLMYLAWNRLEFTKETFTTLLATTDWKSVRELFIYDDGSDDGTRQWLKSQVSNVPARCRLMETRFGSPVTAMVDFIRRADAPILAKIDNDAMYPPGLTQSLDVLDRNRELSLLGIEAMNPARADSAEPRSYTPAKFISGLGLYRRNAFAKSHPRMYGKYFGLEEWQMAQPRLTRGWINPALEVFLLDRFPFEPWKSLSDGYCRRGWQRPWPAYDANCTLWHWRFSPHQSATNGSELITSG